MVGEVFDVIRSGSTLVDSESEEWLKPQDISGPLIVFVHGFTSHGRYLRKLAGYIRAWGFSTALFNYDSYRGIDTGADDLRSRLTAFEGCLSSSGYALVAHSMGGLVALQHALSEGNQKKQLLRAAVLLGTPNSGALMEKRLLSFMLDWADYLTGPNPYARSVVCRSALQLTGNDREHFLVGLRERIQAASEFIPTLSISGGLNFIECGGGQFAGIIKNRIIQSFVGEKPNDGIVGETSADCTKVVLLDGAEHHNNYRDYFRINHTFLTQNQEIAEAIVLWLRRTAFPEATGKQNAGHQAQQT